MNLHPTTTLTLTDAAETIEGAAEVDGMGGDEDAGGSDEHASCSRARTNAARSVGDQVAKQVRRRGPMEISTCASVDPGSSASSRPLSSMNPRSRGARLHDRSASGRIPQSFTSAGAGRPLRSHSRTTVSRRPGTAARSSRCGVFANEVELRRPLHGKDASFLRFAPGDARHRSLASVTTFRDGDGV